MPEQIAPGDKVNPLTEIGVAGLKVASGYVYEEFMPELRGPRGMRVFAEMRDNDPTVGALLFAVDLMSRRVPWSVESKGEGAEADLRHEFLESILDDMSHPWEDFISEALSMLVFGWSYFEIVYKRRVGPLEEDPSRRSRFTDGAIGIRKLAPRSQESLLRWEMQEDGGIAGLWQIPPVGGGTYFIPIERALLFRTMARKNNPEGRSILRNAYRPWWLAKNLENIEGVGIERELAGLPVVRIPARYLTSTAAADIAIRQQYEKIAKDLKFNEQAGLVIPSDCHADQDGRPSSTPLVSVELLSSAGSRTIEPDVPIRRHQGNIARTALADFLMLGQDSAGSFAMSASKSDLFLNACQTYLDHIAAVFNRHAVPRLFALNGAPLEDLPCVKPGRVKPADLDALGTFLERIGRAGATLWPDEALDRHVRAEAGLPEPSEEDLAARREQAEQQADALLQAAQAAAEGEPAAAPGKPAAAPDDAPAGKRRRKAQAAL